MIFIRSQILKKYLQPYIYNNNHSFSLIKKPHKQSNLTNPFQNRTYAQINRIMSMNISQKNQGIFCNFVLKTINQRITKQQYTQLEPKQKQSRQQLINRVFDKLMNNHIQNITPQDLYTILHTYYKIQQIRTCKITENTRIKIKDILFPQIAILLQKDKKGQHKQIFKNVFELMLYFKKKTTFLKHIIDYMSIHGLKSNQELIDFFQKFSYMNRSGFYDSPMELLIGRLMNDKKNNYDNLDQWVKPIVLQTVVLYSKNLRIEGNVYLSKILTGIQRKLDNNSITLKDKILYLGQLFEWCRYSNPYFINLKDSTSGITLIYNIIQSIRTQLNTITKIQLQNFINLASYSYRFQQFIQISARILQKSQKQLINQLSYILYKSFQLSFGDAENTELQDLLGIINAHAGLPHELQQKLNKAILATINKNKNSNFIINWLRLLQSLTVSIKQQKTTQITRNQIVSIIKYLQKKCKSFRIYQNIRLYNIARVLDIKSQIFQQQISYMLSKNQTSIIQNMSRTVLKKYSYSKIQQMLQSLKQKYNKSGQLQVNNTIIQSLWFSFKNIGYQKLQQNQNCDPIFIYWLNKNYQFFQKIVKNRKNNLIIISHVIAQLNTRKFKQGFPSINYQFIFQLLRTWHQLNPNISYQQQCTFYLQNIKNFIQSQQFRFVLIKKYRHSFFIKSMWAFYKLNTYREMIKNYSAKTRSFKQLLILVKQQKLSLYRQKQNLRTSMLYRNIQFVDQYQSLKLQQIDIVYMAWFWSNYHGYKIKITHQIQGTNNFEQDLKKYLIRNYQYTYYMEYILLRGKISLDAIQKNMQVYFKQSIIPEIIYTGQFNKLSVISQQLLLQLLVYQKCMNFLIRKYPHMSDMYVQRIIEIKNPIMNHKIIQAANLVYKIRQLLKLSTRIKFVQWLRDMLTTTCNPNDNPTNLYLCLQFNINTAQLAPSIHTYICQQLTRGNFNIAPLLYINGYTNISEKVSQFLHLVHANRVLVFMQQIFAKQYILLTNSLLGLTLHQNNQPVLQKYITLFLDPKILQKIIKLAVEQNKQIVYQFYILLSIALVRIKQNSKLYKILTQISTALTNKYKITHQIILQNIINKNNSILQLYKIKLSQDVNTGLHIFNEKKIVIHNEQPGYVQLVVQYLEGCGKMEGVIGKTIDQLMGQMEGVQVNVNIK